MATPPVDVLEAGPPLRRTASRRRKRTAPLPAATTSATAPAPMAKWLQTATGQIASLNRLRGTVRKSQGTGTAPY